MSALEEVVLRESIGLVVPTIDTELPVLAAAKERFSGLGCLMLVSDRGFVDTCSDKWSTFTAFRDIGVPTPESWLPPERGLSEWVGELWPRDEPLFVKPRRGSSSKDAYAIDASEVPAYVGRIDDPIIQRRMTGPEITVDCLLSLEGEPLHYVPRERIRTLGGESIQGRTLDDKEIAVWLSGVLDACSRLGARGPITLQAFLTPAGPVLTEVNPRFGGGYPLARAAGGDYPAWLVGHLDAQPTQLELGGYVRDLYMTRYSVEHFAPDLPW